MMHHQDGPGGPLLDREIQRYLGLGFRIVSRSDTWAQMSKPKEFSFIGASLSFLFFGVGLLFYLFYYLSKRDTLVYLAIDDAGALTTRASGYIPPALLTTEVVGDQVVEGACPKCGRISPAHRQFCKLCGTRIAGSTLASDRV